MGALDVESRRTGHFSRLKPLGGLWMGTTWHSTRSAGSNQQDLSFNAYPRDPENHAHQLLTNWKLSTVETNGCELLAKPMGPDFPKGVFIAMSEDTTFHYYDLRKLVVE